MIEGRQLATQKTPRPDEMDLLKEYEKIKEEFTLSSSSQWVEPIPYGFDIRRTEYWNWYFVENGIKKSVCVIVEFSGKISRIGEEAPIHQINYYFPE